MGYKNEQLENRITWHKEVEYILQRYPHLVQEEIVTVAKIYYPFAELEVTLEERSFEEYELIQRTVLEIISHGVNDPTGIRKLTGISEEYIEKIVKLLLSYGHVDEQGNITSLGRESLQSSKKILKVKTGQRLYVDALNGAPVRLDRDPDKNFFVEPEEMDTYVYTVDGIDGIDSKVVLDVFGRDDYAQFREQYTGSRVKVLSVESVECKTIRYATAVIIETANPKRTMVLFKKYLSGRNEIQRHVWEPLYTLNEENSLSGFTDEGKKAIAEAIRKYWIKSQEQKTQDDIEKEENELYQEFGLPQDKRVIAWEDITRFYSNRCWAFINSLCNYGGYVKSESRFFGGVVTVITKDARFKALGDKIEELRARDLLSEWKNETLAYFEKSKDTSVCDYLLKSAKEKRS